MNKRFYINTVFLFFTITYNGLFAQSKEFIARQGQVSFFSYTSAENIEATNNQALSLVDFSENKIALSVLMRAFVFKKTLMYEHFNESYIESDIFPKATFEGELLDYDFAGPLEQTKISKGVLIIHGISKEISIKMNIKKKKTGYLIIGSVDVLVVDFDIKIPPILSKNIAETISIKFRFEYEPYEK